jgi:uncharacterized protein GlcG (DUF336 family)
MNKQWLLPTALSAFLLASCSGGSPASSDTVVDRVGNVLAVYRMGLAANREVLVSTSAGNTGAAVVSAGLEGIRLPVAPVAVNLDDLAAITKAITGAYLSSEGNAFSSRTASQIVQDHFNPGERFQPGGPLFGVQFSQLACSDFTVAWNGLGTSPGPHRSPLGLSADPGGFPLYKDGTVVGGVGVIADGIYGVDAAITDSDRNADEMIAYAASFDYAAPQDRRGDQITVEGKTFRFSDVTFADLSSDPGSAPPFAAIPPATGALIAVTGYTDGVIRAGTPFGQNASGIAPDTGGLFPGMDAFLIVDSVGTPRYPPTGGTDGGSLPVAALSQAEVQSILSNALDIANQSRAQIRRPLGSQARVTISVVDTNGEVLGIVRGRDAPIFGADVSLQKARTAALFSSSTAAAYLQALPSVSYMTTTDAGEGLVFSTPPVLMPDYVTAVQNFLGDPNALTNGEFAFSDRAGGNMSRPYFPDGIDGNAEGPFSKPAGMWSPFSTGLQLDLAYNAILQHVLFAVGALPADVLPGCGGVQLDVTLAPLTLTFSQTVADNRAGNGLQIFPGSVPIYRNDVLVGGIGVSGDGVDQDDMIAFLGVHNAGLQIGNGIGNAPPAMRADNLTPQGTRLRYIQCPQAPFLGSPDDNVCDGK